MSLLLIATDRYLHSPYFLDGDQELLSQLNNSYVQRGPGNGIKIYRGSSYGQGINSINPGIFTSEAQTGGYKLVEASWVASDRDLFDTYLDVEPATGLTMEAQLRYGVSLSAWECNPEENSACMLAVKSKGQADCYDMMGQIYFDSLDAATRAYFTSSGRNNFTYPCSAANVLTPKVVAGKIIPTYWFDTSTAATLSDVDKLVAVGKLYRKFQAIFILTVMLGLITASIGSILLCCTCTCRRSRAVVPK